LTDRTGDTAELARRVHVRPQRTGRTVDSATDCEPTETYKESKRGTRKRKTQQWRKRLKQEKKKQIRTQEDRGHSLRVLFGWHRRRRSRRYKKRGRRRLKRYRWGSRCTSKLQWRARNGQQGKTDSQRYRSYQKSGQPGMKEEERRNERRG
jgi:hypothetical protein